MCRDLRVKLRDYLGEGREGGDRTDNWGIVGVTINHTSFTPARIERLTEKQMIDL